MSYELRAMSYELRAMSYELRANKLVLCDLCLPREIAQQRLWI